MNNRCRKYCLVRYTHKKLVFRSNIITMCSAHRLKLSTESLFDRRSFDQSAYRCLGKKNKNKKYLTRRSAAVIIRGLRRATERIRTTRVGTQCSNLLEHHTIVHRRETHRYKHNTLSRIGNAYPADTAGLVKRAQFVTIESRTTRKTIISLIVRGRI